MERHPERSRVRGECRVVVWGRRYPVVWRFAQGKVWIDGEHGMECIVDLPVMDLIASIV